MTEISSVNLEVAARTAQGQSRRARIEGIDQLVIMHQPRIKTPEPAPMAPTNVVASRLALNVEPHVRQSKVFQFVSIQTLRLATDAEQLGHFVIGLLLIVWRDPSNG